MKKENKQRKLEEQQQEWQQEQPLQVLLEL